MTIPPVPTLPPASDLRKYKSSPPDFMSPLKRYHADEQSQNLVYDAWEAPSVQQKFAILQRALKCFPYSVDALAAWADIYARKLNPPDLEKAEKTYELALSAARLLWPTLEQQESIEWGHIEYRPFLRAKHGLATIQSEMGKSEEAINAYRYLLKVNPNDNQGVRILLFGALLETGDYKLAEEIAELHSDGRKTESAYFRYGFVLIDFLNFKLGVCSEADLHSTLSLALACNPFVPPLLLGQVPLEELPKTTSPGGEDEATSVAHRMKNPWQRTPGMIDWLREQQTLGGAKPDDGGKILFKLLRKGRILVDTKTDENMDLTTAVRLIPGTGLEEFYLAPGMKDHDPSKIVAFDFRKAYDHDSSFRDKYVSFSYEDVVSIPFWKVLKSSEAFNKDYIKDSCDVCYKDSASTLCCSACKIRWYCSKECQLKDWKGSDRWGASHKVMCPKFQKT